MASCYRLLVFERMDPRDLVRWMIIAAILYFVFPFDLIPDYIGLPGRLDDLATLGLVGWYYWRHVRRPDAHGAGMSCRSGARARA